MRLASRTVRSTGPPLLHGGAAPGIQTVAWLSGGRARLAASVTKETDHMKRMLLAAVALSAAGAAFPATHHAHAAAPQCAGCGTVQEVHAEKRQGEGGAVGLVGGALVGGLLGHQVGGGTGRTLATVGGAAGGAYVGNEVQKRANARTVWITTVRMSNGSVRRFEQAQRPAWGPGAAVREHDHRLRRM
jgi:outer membrane lipoprotein SlyB